MVKAAILTAAAMIAFAANSILARLALGSQTIDALGYTGVRLAAGALTLVTLLALRTGGLASARERISGSLLGASALFGYAFTFSMAYLMLGTGAGALILFSSVQIGMLGWAVYKGDRPGALEWTGMALALGGLAYLVSPGLAAPPLAGTVLMGAAGLCWAAYTLLGRGARLPLSETAGNFARCLPLASILAVAGAFLAPPDPMGLVYAACSGAIASGIGYAIWYAVLPTLSRTRAAIVQLTVPAIAAAGGVLFIGEPIRARLIGASVTILGGVALAIVAAERRRRRGEHGS